MINDNYLQLCGGIYYSSQTGVKHELYHRSHRCCKRYWSCYYKKIIAARVSSDRHRPTGKSGQWEITQKIESSEISRWKGISQDITQQQTTQNLIAELLEKHNITGLVNAAGVLIMRSMLEAKTEDWQTLFAVNVMAPIAISQQLAKHFCEKKQGSIVTISSNSARMPRIQLGMYARPVKLH